MLLLSRIPVALASLELLAFPANHIYIWEGKLAGEHSLERMPSRIKLIVVANDCGRIQQLLRNSSARSSRVRHPASGEESGSEPAFTARILYVLMGTCRQ